MTSTVAYEEVAHAALACPDCHLPLERRSEGLHCDACGSTFPVRDGIASFCTEDAFYDEYLDEHCPYVRNPPPWKRALLNFLPYWSWREWRFFTGKLRPGMRILDLGCARGKEWFSSVAELTAGVDPTFAPLRECSRHYDVVAQAEIVRLPFEDGSFDCVVTSHVLGHIEGGDKDAALSEIARVLRPGGLSLNIIETDSRHRFVQLGKSDPELYVRNFVETDGHVGLELPSAVVARFRDHGLRAVRIEKMEAGLVHLRYYEKYLENGYAERHPSVRRRVRLWRFIERHDVPLACYEVLMGTYHRFVAPWRTHLDDAMFIAAAFVKDPVE